MSNLRTVAQQALEFVTSKQWGTTPYMDTRVYEDAARLRDTLRAELEQAEQEPVAREWQILSEEEIITAVWESDLDWRQGWTDDDNEPNRYTQLTRAIEAMLKAKNTQPAS